MDARKIVRAGYNEIASSYATARTDDSEDVQLLDLLVDRLPKGAMVLDAGCGSGYPVAQFLAEFFHVVGLDFAEKQIRLAKETVPDAAFVCGALSSMPFRKDSFGAVCSYYGIIHIPRQEHSKLLRDIHRILRMNGLALLCMGAGDLPKDIDDYHGAKMYWSHYDSETNLQMMNQSKFEILSSSIVQDPIDPHASHLFVLGRKR